MYEAAIQGLINIFQWPAFLAMMGGIAVGTYTAITPRVGNAPDVRAFSLGRYPMGPYRRHCLSYRYGCGQQHD